MASHTLLNISCLEGLWVWSSATLPLGACLSFVLKFKMLFSSLCCIVGRTQGLFLRPTSCSCWPAHSRQFTLLDFMSHEMTLLCSLWAVFFYKEPCTAGSTVFLTAKEQLLCESLSSQGLPADAILVTSIWDCAWSWELTSEFLSSRVSVSFNRVISLPLFRISENNIGCLSNHFYMSLGRVYVVLLPFGIRDVFPILLPTCIPGIYLTWSWGLSLCVLIDKGGWCSA